MGPTTLLDLPREDRASVGRWHRNEWDKFREEVKAYKERVLDAGRSAYLRARNCRKCIDRRRRLYDAMMRFPKHVLMAPIPSMGRHRASVGGDCSYTASTIPALNDFCINPCTSRARARLHTDGDWYWSEGTTSWGASRGTWDGDCAISDYDSRWNTISGDAPNEGVSGADGVWSDASVTGAAIGLSVGFGTRSGSYDVEIRDGTSLNVLFTDAFTMSVEADAKN
jgi:hypothetical protein